MGPCLNGDQLMAIAVETVDATDASVRGFGSQVTRRSESPARRSRT
jgi:hypothetical protein